jgi:hypothetical protein
LTDVKNIEIHQAFYGEVNRSHSCITSSIADEKLNSYLTGFSDKPYPIPVGITLSTYYAATVFERYFIFTKTIPDFNASRAGMVFTHALIIDLRHIGNVENLGELFLHFVISIPEKSIFLAPVHYKSEKALTLATNQYPAYIKQSVANLACGRKVAFFGDLDSFVKMITLLWNGLPAPLRKHLVFSVGFNSDDIENKKEPILFFQKHLISRVHYDGSVCDDNELLTEISDGVEQMILGHTKVNKFAEFLDLLNCRLSDFKQLSTAEKAFRLFEKRHVINADDLRQLIRLLGKLSPSSQDGISLKTSLIKKSTRFIIEGEDDNIKALRNIDLSGFYGGEIEFSAAVAYFINAQFTGKLSFNAGIVVELIELSARPVQDSWWYSTVKTEITKAVSLSQSVDNIWIILRYPGSIAASFLPLLRIDQQDILIQHLPSSIEPKQILILKSLLKYKGWYKLYANLSLLIQAPVAAFQEQLRLKEDLDLKEGINLIADKISDQQMLEFNLMHDDHRALTLLTERLVKNPVLLNSLNLQHLRWLVVWENFLQKTDQFALGIIDPSDKAVQLCDLIVEGRLLPQKILSLLSRSNFANLSAYNNRTAFWKSVPNDYKDSFLHATAMGFAGQIAENALSDDKLEPELLKVMRGDQFVSSFLLNRRNNLDSVLSYYQTIDLLSDKFLADFVNYYSGSVSDFTSQRLGNIVLSKPYYITANAVFNRAKNNTGFKIALNIVKPLLNLSIVDRFVYGYLFGENLNEQAVYEVLFEVVKELYKKGPEESGIWQRAGGDDSKLINQNSREENWRQALHLLRHGGGGKNATVKSLLKEINEDFPSNIIIKELRSYFKNKQ